VLLFMFNQLMLIWLVLYWVIFAGQGAFGNPNTQRLANWDSNHPNNKRCHCAIVERSARCRFPAA
jgi:hypothetical protein